MKRFGITRIGTGFGMTEIGAPIASDGLSLVNFTSCGKPHVGPPHYEVRVVDDHDEPVGPNVVGELVVRAGDPWVLNSGYFGMPDVTARGMAQRLVPHRRRLQVRRGRQLLLRRSLEGRDTPKGRERLVVRGRVVREPAPEGGGVRRGRGAR